MRECEGDDNVTIITMRCGMWFASHVVSMKGKMSDVSEQVD